MRKLLIISAVAFLPCLLMGQDRACGTYLKPGHKELLRGIYNPSDKTDFRVAAEVKNLAVSAHIIRRNNGTGGITQEQLGTALDGLNEFYEDADLHFFLIAINELNSSYYFDLHTSEEVDLTATRDIDNTINIYFVNSLTNEQGADLCGLTYYPEELHERIILKNSCVTAGNSLPHEMGHFFSLIHTHGDTFGQTDEFVDGTNCATAGDDICDTPADPGLSTANVNTSCVYTGSSKDSHGDTYIPEVNNLMSYSRTDCRDSFSSQQYQRMRAAYHEFRTNIYSKPLVASFETTTTTICEGTSIQFQNHTLGGASEYYWEFSGGTPVTSTQSNPTVSYNTHGFYTVKLMVTDEEENEDSVKIESYIQVVVPEVPAITFRSETFEDELSMQIINPENDMTFSYSEAAKSGQQSIAMLFFDYGKVGRKDYLKFEPVNTAVNKLVEVSFDYAYAYWDNTFADELQLVYKLGCDTEWMEVWQARGADLATAGSQSEYFAPSSGDWEHKSLQFQVEEGVEAVDVALRTVNGFGNNLYLDNLYIETGSTEDFGEIALTPSGVSCNGESNGTLEVTAEGTGSFDFSLDQSIYIDSGWFENLSPGNHLLYVRKDTSSLLARSFIVPQPDSVMVDYQIQVNSCSSGSIYTVLADGMGGSGGYQYSLDEAGFSENAVFNNISPGDHSLAVIDANACMAETTFNLETYEAMELNIQVEDIECHGDSTGILDIQASGGNGALQYFLSGVATGDSSYFPGLPYGTYSVRVVDENNCEITSWALVDQNEAIEVEPLLNQPNCYGDVGSLEVGVTGGVGELRFSLDSGNTWTDITFFENLTPGSYTLTVSDELTCASSQRVDVVEPSLLGATIISEDETCIGSYLGMIEVNPMGGTAPYSVFLDGNSLEVFQEDSLKAGLYVVEVVDGNGCTYTDSVEIDADYTFPSAPIISVDSLDLSVEDQGYDIKWYRNGEMMQGAADTMISVDMGGSYQASYSHPGAVCEVFSQSVVVLDVKLGDYKFKLFPNPVTRELNLQIGSGWESKVSQVRIRDLTGRTVYRSGWVEQIQMELPAGIYLIEVVGAGMVISRRFVKQ